MEWTSALHSVFAFRFVGIAFENDCLVICFQLDLNSAVIVNGREIEGNAADTGPQIFTILIAIDASP